MNGLFDMIETVKTRLNKFPECSTNESTIRNSIIDPVLKVLGWDVSDPERVMSELTNDQKKIPDYTFFKNGKKIIILEAKTQKCDIKNHVSQVFSYCGVDGVTFGILTNGKEWILLKTDLYDRGPEREVWRLDVTDSFETLEKKFYSISYDNIEQLPKCWEELYAEDKLTNVWNKMVPEDILNFLISCLSTQLLKETGVSCISNTTLKEFVEDKLLTNDYEVCDELNEVEHKRKNAPANIIKVIIDGKVFYDNHSKYTFIEIIKYLGIERVRDLSVFFKNRNIIIDDTICVDKKYYRKLDDTYMLYTNFSTNTIKDYIKHICNLLNIPCIIQTVLKSDYQESK